MSQPGFGYMLQKLREKRNLSLRELSEKAGVDHVYIHRLETSEHDAPSSEVVARLAAALRGNARETEILSFLSDHPMISAGLVRFTLSDETITPKEFILIAAFIVRGKVRPDYPQLLKGVRGILRRTARANLRRR